MNLISPDHYKRTNGKEVIDAIDIIVDGLPPKEAYCIGSAIKYLGRYRQKGDPIENVNKAIKFLEFAKDRIRENTILEVPVGEFVEYPPEWDNTILI